MKTTASKTGDTIKVNGREYAVVERSEPGANMKLANPELVAVLMVRRGNMGHMVYEFSGGSFAFTGIAGRV